MKVSIITCTYGDDRQDILAPAIRSVLQQEYQNWELIVVNDGGTPPAIPDDRRICLVNKEKSGQPGAFNTGIVKATGSIITFLDDDDLYYPHNLQAKVEALQSTDADLVYFPVNSVRSGKAPDSSWGRHGWNKEEILMGNCIPNLGLAIRSQVFRRAGLFDERWWTHHDWEWQLRAVHKGIKGVFVDSSPVGEYTLTEAGDAKRARAREIGLQQQIRGLYTDTAKVAVIMPIYNMEAWRIKRAVDSVYNQGCTWWHLYMIYDGEPGEGQYYEPEPNINTTIKIIPHGGDGDARRHAISLGKEPIITYLDADDFWHSGHLWAGIYAIRENPFVFFKAVAFGDWENPTLRREEIPCGDPLNHGILPDNIYWRPERLEKHNVMITNGVLHTRELYNQTDGWHSQEWFTDHDMWKRLGRICPPVLIDEITSEYEVRSDSLSYQRKRRAGVL